MIWPFKKKKSPIKEREKRNFDNVPWGWFTKPGFKSFHVFKFANGLGVIVFKESRSTYDGMEAIAFERMDDGTFLKLQAFDVVRYNHIGGVGVEEVQQLCNEVRNLRKYSKTSV